MVAGLQRQQTFGSIKRRDARASRRRPLIKIIRRFLTAQTPSDRARSHCALAPGRERAKTWSCCGGDGPSRARTWGTSSFETSAIDERRQLTRGRLLGSWAAAAAAALLSDKTRRGDAEADIKRADGRQCGGQPGGGPSDKRSVFMGRTRQTSTHS